MNNNSIQSVAIIGAGKLGKALAIELNKLNALSWIYVRNSERAQELANFIPKNCISSTLDSCLITPDLIFIATDDNNISNTAEKIAEVFAEKLQNTIIAHLSGSRSIQELQAVENFAVNCIGAHPYQTFYEYQENLFDGIAWSIESRNEVPILIDFIERLKGVPIYLPQTALDNKPLYHLSAVFASNFINTALYFANKSADAAGIDSSIFFRRLTETTIQNALATFKTNAKPALTGPISRGDSLGVAKHFQALKNYPEIQTAYKMFSKATLILAESEGLIDSSTAKKINDVLE